MAKKIFLLLVAAAFVMVFASTGLQAGTAVEDTFKIKTKEIKKHKKEAPTLSHKKHNEEYKISCGECHHDKDNKPLDLKMGDDVQRCVECHTKLKKPKTKDKKKKNDIMILENAMHGNCITCHKEINKKAGDPKGKKGPAPASCSKCHPKKKK